MQRTPVYTIFPQSATSTTSNHRPQSARAKSQAGSSPSAADLANSFASIFPAPPSKEHTESGHPPTSQQLASPYQQALPPTPDSLRPSEHQLKVDHEVDTSDDEEVEQTPDVAEAKHNNHRRHSSTTLEELAQFHRELARYDQQSAALQNNNITAAQLAAYNKSRQQTANSRKSYSGPSASQAASKSTHHPSPKTSKQERRASKVLNHEHSYKDERPPVIAMSTLTSSSTSSLSLSKPTLPAFSPTTTAVESPMASPMHANRPSHSHQHSHNSGAQGRPHGDPRNGFYFHGGIGGAGNYRKVKTESKRAPRAYAENVNPLNRKGHPGNFLSGLFGGRGRGNSGPGGDMHDFSAGPGFGRGNLDDGRSATPASVTGSDESYREEVSLGAAEVLRRKMVASARKKRAN